MNFSPKTLLLEDKELVSFLAPMVNDKRFHRCLETALAQMTKTLVAGDLTGSGMWGAQIAGAERFINTLIALPTIREAPPVDTQQNLQHPREWERTPTKPQTK